MPRHPYYQEDLVAEIVGRFKVSAAHTKALVRVCLDCWRRAILRGEAVHLPGLGVLYACDVPAHETRVPSTGQRVAIPAYRKLKTRVAADLKRALREPHVPA